MQRSITKLQMADLKINKSIKLKKTIFKMSVVKIFDLLESFFNKKNIFNNVYKLSNSSEKNSITPTFHKIYVLI